MRFRRLFLVALVLVGAASAQTPEDGLRSTINAVHYARLAEQARIQGDVHLNVKSGVVNPSLRTPDTRSNRRRERESIRIDSRQNGP